MSSAAPETELLAQIESGQADRRILEFAARGFLPLPPAEVVRAVSTIAASGDAELVALAEETFKTFEGEALLAAVLSDGVKGIQLDSIARRTTDPKVLEPLIRARGVPDETLAWLAERLPAYLQDVLITNQARLLAAPYIVERLFENPQLSTDIRRRADEFVEEFFLKKLREEEEAEAKAAEEADKAAAKAAAEAEKGPPIDPELLPEEQKKSLFARVSTMSVMERIKLAYGGTREERLFLVRDRNRLVSQAVLKSPKTNEAEAETIANMKNVSEDVLRVVASRRDWMKKYTIMLSIVRNPRSPLEATIPIVNRLMHKDQKSLAGDRNVPEQVRVFARRAVARRDAG